MPASIHIATGLDGKPSIWPAMAVSKDRNGVFKDIRGRIVPSPADRLGTAMDSALPAKRKSVGKDSDKAIDALVRKLFPALKRMVAEAAEGEDGKEEEQEALFGGAAEDSTDQYTEVNKAYRDEKAKWAAFNLKNAERRSLSGQYQPVNAAARQAARKAS